MPASTCPKCGGYLYQPVATLLLDTPEGTCYLCTLRHEINRLELLKMFYKRLIADAPQRREEHKWCLGETGRKHIVQWTSLGVASWEVGRCQACEKVYGYRQGDKTNRDRVYFRDGWEETNGKDS